MHWIFSVFILLFVLIPITLMWIYALVDIFLNPGLSLVARAFWLVVVILLPFFGAVIYHLFKPVSDDLVYFRTTWPVAASAVDQIAKADELKNSGTITEEEFNRIKSNLLA